MLPRKLFQGLLKGAHQRGNMLNIFLLQLVAQGGEGFFFLLPGLDGRHTNFSSHGLVPLVVVVVMVVVVVVMMVEEGGPVCVLSLWGFVSKGCMMERSEAKEQSEAVRLRAIDW